MIDTTETVEQRLARLLRDGAAEAANGNAEGAAEYARAALDDWRRWQTGDWKAEAK